VSKQLESLGRRQNDARDPTRPRERVVSFVLATMGKYACVALVSGGKDGALAAMETAGRDDADVVCLANLCPLDPLEEESDSHCFQTVGHRAMDALGELTGLRVFRRRMRGRSRALGLEYPKEGENGDEVEDLRALLAGVKKAMPEVNAVCSGAILSDYQRLRVESVCADLGLTSIAPLWRVPQREVLRRTAERGVDARLIKVAAMGLRPEKHLGMTIVDATPELVRIEDEYGSYCAGEGGEFETLVVDCPLFARARMEFKETRVVTTSADRFAPSGHLVIESFDVVLKPGGEKIAPAELTWIEDDFERLPAVTVERLRFDVEPGGSLARVQGSDCRVSSSLSRKASSITGSVSHLSVSLRCSGADHSMCAEAIFQRAKQIIAAELGEEAEREAWNKVTMTHVYLDDMSQFAQVNAVYSKHMRSVAPSARACVATSFPDGTKVQIDCLFTLGEKTNRKSLHVQSLSTWAPACIGPYGQSIGVNGLVHVAGQIGMEPTTLDLVPGIASQLERAMRSAVAVAEISGAPLGSQSLALTLYSSAKYGDEYAAANAHPSRVMLDALENEIAASARKFSWQPLVTQLVVTDLPKNCIGEIAPTLIIGKGPGAHEDDEGDETVDKSIAQSESGPNDAFQARCVYREERFIRLNVSVRSAEETKIDDIVTVIDACTSRAKLSLSQTLSCRLYHRTTPAAERFASALDASLGARVDGASRLQSVVTPVVACGLDASIDDDIVLEMFASID